MERFNLKHFLAKRKIPVVEWLNSNSISSAAQYETFVATGEFAVPQDLSAEIYALLSKPSVPLMPVTVDEAPKQLQETPKSVQQVSVPSASETPVKDEFEASQGDPMPPAEVTEASQSFEDSESSEEGEKTNSTENRTGPAPGGKKKAIKDKL